MAPDRPDAAEATPMAALRRLGAAHRTDVERVPLLRASGRVLAEPVTVRDRRLEAGRRLQAADLGHLAETGRPDVLCARRPTVAVFTAGRGLKPPGQSLGDGERHDACRAVLMALLQQEGLDPVAWPILPNDPAKARPALDDAAQAFDLIVTCDAVDDSGRPKLAACFDPGDRVRGVSVPFADVAQAVCGPLGPRALWFALPDRPADLVDQWPATVGAVLAAMQGASEAPASPAPEGRGLEVSVVDVEALRRQGARWVDVREPEEQALGMPEGVEALPLSRIERDPDALRGTAAPLVLICASGKRSLRAASLLRERGIASATSFKGGLAAWRSAGLPMRRAAQGEVAGSLDDDALARYDRHLRLAAVGIEGQKRLLAARVLIVGAGGLGSPAAFYLAAAGVGHLLLVDDDRVDRSNLQRQILHTDASVGHAKVDSARERLRALNPSIRVDAIDGRLDAGNVEGRLAGVDLVIDGSDNFPTRYLVDAACLRLGIPLVYGAVERFTGQVAVFDAGRQRGSAPCYRCLFPEPPGADAAPNCAEAGVLGVLPGLVGLLQATEALKLLLGIGDPLIGRMLTVDALAMRFRTLALPVDPDCPGCGAAARFEGYPAIEHFCSVG